jgi:hypothetical protein
MLTYEYEKRNWLTQADSPAKKNMAMKTCSSGIDRHCGLHVGRISFPSVLSPVVGPFFPWPTLLCFNDRS